MQLRRRETLEKLSGFLSLFMLLMMMYYLWAAVTNEPLSAQQITEQAANHPAFFILAGTFLVRTVLDFMWIEIEEREGEPKQLPEPIDPEERALQRARARAAQGLKFFISLLLIGILELAWLGYLPAQSLWFQVPISLVLVLFVLTEYYEGEMLKVREDQSRRRWIKVSYTVLATLFVLELIVVIALIARQAG